jgi:hypothetical protein
MEMLPTHISHCRPAGFYLHRNGKVCPRRAKRPRPRCLHPPTVQTAFRPRGVVAGSEAVRRHQEGALGVERHPFGQALCPADGTGDLSLEWQAPKGGSGHGSVDLPLGVEAMLWGGESTGS